jgi:hypothetical protein
LQLLVSNADLLHIRNHVGEQSDVRQAIHIEVIYFLPGDLLIKLDASEGERILQLVLRKSL